MNKLIKDLKIHIYADGANSKEVAIFNKLKYGYFTGPPIGTVFV